MPPIVFDIFDILAALLRLLGMLIFGLGIAWFALEFFHKGEQTWPLQAVVFLGFLGVAIGFAAFVPAAGLGAFVLGAGIGLLMWGRQAENKAKAAEEDEEKK